MIFPKLYQPEKSQPKQRRVFFFSSVAVGLFLERAQCCSINSTHHNPALHISRHKAGAVQGCNGAGTRWNAVPANIFEPERRSGKYRWPQVDRYSLGWPSISSFSGPNCPQTRDLASKISKQNFRE